MVKSKKSSMFIIVLIIPFLVLMGLNMNAAVKQSSGSIWKIKITGYDPRDLLYGHYLVYRYDFNLSEDSEQVLKTINSNDLCLCLNSSKTGSIDPVVQPMSCKQAEEKMCSSVIKGYNHYGGLALNNDGPSERYFIPEKDSLLLESALRKGEKEFHIELVAHNDRSVSIRRLLVDYEPLEVFLREQALHSVGVPAYPPAWQSIHSVV